MFSNRGFAAALGYSLTENFTETEFLHSVMQPDDWLSFLDHLDGLTVLAEQVTAEFEYRLRHSAGGWRSFHSREKVFTCREDGTVIEIISTAVDFTERKDIEERAKFLAELNETLRPLSDPEQIMQTTVRMLGEHLAVDRCAYAEVVSGDDSFTVMGEYVRNNAVRIGGRYRMSGFGEMEQRILLENQPYVVNDIELEGPPGADLQLYRRGGIRSLVCVPLNKGGRFMARMAVHQSTPRHWSSGEIKLITAVANRCWETVQRARVARSLQESEERYRAFIANSSEAIFRFELEQPIPLNLPEEERFDLLYKVSYLAECNDAMALMHGYERAEQIIGMRIGELLPRNDLQNIAFLRAFKESNFRLVDAETHGPDKQGNTRYFLNNLNGVLEGDTIVRAWGTCRDITDQKNAEEALRKSEEQFSKAFKASPNALVISRLKDGYILEVNDAFISGIGYSRDELIGHSTISLDLYADSEMRDRLVSLMKQAHRIRDAEVPLRRKNGEVRIYSFSAEPLRIHGEDCWLTLGRDITEELQAEEERVKNEKEREQLLLQEKAAREGAETASRMKDEFLATISHELRTPLTSILGWARLLSEGRVPETQTNRALQVITQNAEAQARLVDDILDTSRIITGRFRLDAQAIDIEKVFQAAIDVIRPSAEARKIKLIVEIDCEGSVVFGDASRLQQVIWNLLANAVKFTNEGGSVEARLNRLGDQIEISVTDTGVGIDPQFLPFIFDRFRQADSSSTRRYGGLGLGLAIVRHIVEMHGGDVSAMSPGVGLGATFKVRFPALEPAQLRAS